MKVFTVIFTVALVSLKKTIVIAECTIDLIVKTRRVNGGEYSLGERRFNCFEDDLNLIEHTMSSYPCQYSFCDNFLDITELSIPTLGPIGYNWFDLKKLKISHTNTSVIYPGFFNNLDSLTELEISHNEIKEIVGGLFARLEKLIKLNLSRNLIDNLSEHCFSSNLNLEIVDLSYNLLKVIPDDVFKYQINLTFVDISNNLLMNVENIFTKQPIHHLYLSHNNLQNIDLTKFFSVNSLKVLDFSYNNLTILSPKTFENCTNLTSLLLHHNKIQSLRMDIFVSLEKLKILDLSFNNLSEIPFGLLNHLRSLEYLNISNNPLTLDFHTLFTLSNLTYLNLQNIKITNMNLNFLLDSFRKLTEIALPKYDFKWNCIELTRFISILQKHKIHIVHSNITNSNNVLGIPCEHLNVTRMEMTPNPNKNYSFNTDNEPIFSLNNSILFRYLDTIVRKLENIEGLYLKQSLNKNVFENLTVGKVNDFFQHEFLNTSFVKYLNSFPTKQKFVVQINNTDFLTKAIVTNLKNLSENTQKIITWRNISSNILDQKESNAVPVNITAQALLKDKIEHNTSNDSNLVLNNVLLLFILFCLLAIILKNINYSFIKQRFRNSEELELVNQT
ncbi:hypothetical protein ABEB36_008077 [Hypothenemus hampei]|uniref:Uncharacterized protein n=1 Tax=Hypothenemus hampei TaxID=57062 RepID=A0ABD1EKM8_HYPHA